MGTLLDRGFGFVLRLSEGRKNVISRIHDTSGKDLQYEYKPQSVGQIVPRFLVCIFAESKSKCDRLWKKVEQFYKSSLSLSALAETKNAKPPRDIESYPKAHNPRLSRRQCLKVSVSVRRRIPHMSSWD